MDRPKTVGTTTSDPATFSIAPVPFGADCKNANKISKLQVFYSLENVNFLQIRHQGWANLPPPYDSAAPCLAGHV